MNLKQVFKVEAHTRKQAMTGAQRLAYHQQHSRPLLDALKPWMEAQLNEREVEPASDNAAELRDYQIRARFLEKEWIDALKTSRSRKEGSS